MRAAALLALGVSVLVAMFLLWDGADGAAPTPRAVAPVAAPEAPAVSLRGAAAASEPAVTERRTVRAAPAPAPPAEPEPAASALIRGRVFDPDGRPVGGAPVAAMALVDGGPGQHPGHASTETAADGSFAVAVPEGTGPLALVARHAGTRPATRILARNAGALAGFHELALEAGFALVGRVVDGGAPVAGAHVSLDLAFGTPGVFGFGSEAFWRDGRLEEKHAAVHTDEDGRFRLAGLGPYEHDLHLGLPTQKRHSLLDLRRRVSVPQQDWRIDVAGAELEVVVQRLGEVPTDAVVVLAADGRQVEVRTEGKPVRCAVPPLAEVRVEVRQPTSSTAVRSVAAGREGERQQVLVVLQPVARPSLLVRLPGATRAGVEAVEVRLWPKGGGEEVTLPAPAGPGADRFDVEVVPLEPGAYEVAVGPAGEGAGHYVYPVVGELRLPPAGVVEFRGTLQWGGRLDVSISAARQEQWSASWVLRAPSGDAVLSRSVFNAAISPGGGRGVFMVFGMDFWAAGKSSGADAGRLAGRAGIVPAGSYTLEVSGGGFETWRAPVTIEPQKTARVEVQLVEAKKGG